MVSTKTPLLVQPSTNWTSCLRSEKFVPHSRHPNPCDLSWRDEPSKFLVLKHNGAYFQENQRAVGNGDSALKRIMYSLVPEPRAKAMCYPKFDCTASSNVLKQHKRREIIYSNLQSFTLKAQLGILGHKKKNVPSFFKSIIDI